MVRRHLKKPAKKDRPQRSQTNEQNQTKKQPKRTANKQAESRKGFRQHAEVHVEINYGRKGRHQMHWLRAKENHEAERSTDHMVHSRSALHSAGGTFAHR